MIKKFLYALLLLCSFISSAQIAVIPFELQHDIAFIYLRVNGKDSLYFMFDTGAGGVLMDTETARYIGLKNEGVNTNYGGGGNQDGTYSTGNNIDLGRARIPNVRISTLSLDGVSKSIGKKVDGIIGYELLYAFATEVSYTKQQIILYTFDQVSKGKDAISLKIKTHRPYAKGSIILPNGERIRGKIMIDSGAQLAMNLNNRIVDKYKLIETGKQYEYKTGFGSDGNRISNPIVSIPMVSLGGIDMKGLSCILNATKVKDAAVENRSLGALGNIVLKEYNQLYDYKRKKMYLKVRQ